jgi:hypothetical protein
MAIIQPTSAHFIRRESYCMNYFTVFAHGSNFDVDTYLRCTKLRFDHVWHLGEPKRFSCVGSPHETSGVEILLGDGARLTLDEQNRLAIDYIAANCDELRVLGKFPGVETFRVGLQRNITFHANLLCLCIGSSKRLMGQTLDIGADLSYYLNFQPPHFPRLPPADTEPEPGDIEAGQDT